MTRQLATGAAIGLGLLLVLDAIAVRAGLAPGALPTIVGPSPWLTSRAAGLTAFVAVALDVIAGLACRPARSTATCRAHARSSCTAGCRRWRWA